ncbi:MAG: transposase [Deltaproteobacteria bacterium]|nr:transposase [Deltaproteobacteria bacterium]
MARPLRIEYEGAFYHITARGNEQKRIYFNKTDYGKFREYLEGAREKYGCLIHAYVFMTNHYHMIIETPNANISKIMHFINGSYTTYINKKRDRSGHLFQGRYKAILIDRDTYLLELSRYIHLNPVRARSVEKPEDFLNSSYASYIGKRNDTIVYHEQLLQMISNNKKSAPKLYKEFVESGIGADLENPLSKTYGGSILGEQFFIKQALRKVKEGVVSCKETSHRKALKSPYQSDVIVDAVSDFFGIDNNEVLNNRSQYRNICIYIMKKYTGMTNGQIGQIFNGLSFSAVAKVYQRMSKAIEENRAMRKKVDKIISTLS